MIKEEVVSMRKFQFAFFAFLTQHVLIASHGDGLPPGEQEVGMPKPKDSSYG